jgi:hypothetical protein
MSLATLSIDLEARLAGLQQGMDKAARLAEKESARITAAFAGTSQALLGVGSALAGAFSVSVITQFVRATVDGIDKLNDLADATGASVENISALEDIAARTGTTIDTVGSALVKLNQGLNDTNPDSGTALALKQIGLSAAELRKLDPAEALRQIAVAMSGYAAGGANKARLVQELFGKSVKEVGPLLKDLAEAGQLNATVTAQQAREAEKFNQQLSAFNKNVTDAARSIIGSLLPAINQLFDAGKSGRLMEALGAIPSGYLKGGLPGAFEAYRKTLQGIEGANAGRRPANEGGGRYELPSVGEIPARGGRSRSGRVDIPYAIRDPLADQKAAFLRSEREAVDDIDQFLKEQAGRVQQAAYAILDPLQDTKQKFLAAEKEGYEDTDALLKRMGNNVERTKGLAEELGLTFTSAFEDAIVGGNSLRDVLKGLEQDILRIVTRKLVTEPLGNALTGLLGGGGGILDGLTKAVGSLFSGGFATGGFIAPGRWGVVGERGPEPAFGGRTGMTVQPSGGGMTVVINQTISGNYDARTRSQLAADTARAVERAAARNN